MKDFQPPKLSGLKVSAVVWLMKTDQSMFDLLRKLSNSSASKYKIMFFHGFFFFLHLNRARTARRWTKRLSTELTYEIICYFMKPNLKKKRIKSLLAG